MGTGNRSNNILLCCLVALVVYIAVRWKAIAPIVVGYPDFSRPNTRDPGNELDWDEPGLYDCDSVSVSGSSWVGW